MRRSKYPTDLSDAEWTCLKLHLSAPKKRGRGRPNVHSPRKILNAVFYLLKSGCPWRLLPRDFPPWKTVYHWFRKWRIDGTFEQLNLALRERLRTRLGRNSQPSAGIVDSQSAKTSGAGGEPRRYDGGKKVRGRKRHLLVNMEGLVLKAKVHSAKVPDQDGIELLLKIAREHLPRLSHLWVDAGYQGRGREWVVRELELSVEVLCIVRRIRRLRRSQGSGLRSGRSKERRSIGRGCFHVRASNSCRGVGWWNALSRG